MKSSSEVSQKSPTGASEGWPWPLPERPTLLFICASKLAVYRIGIVLEQSAKDDPHGMLRLRAEKTTRRGPPVISILAEWHIPLAGLNRERAESHFREMETFICKQAQIDANCVRRVSRDSAVN
jgi:hypothetical protein